MTHTRRTIRVFISSPGDVEEERDKAKKVVEGLRRQIPAAVLEPVLWEDLALPATASFQETIDYFLEQQPIDIAVFILWSRLGSQLGPTITRRDGTPYRSGTEREFELMLAAHEASGRDRPVILAYVRDDYEGFAQKLVNSSKAERDDLLEQRQLTENFIVEHFQDSQGHNVRAYQSFREPIQFSQRLRTHLSRIVVDIIGADALATWNDEPYRGLDAFKIEHADIFYGREDETLDVVQRLQDQLKAGCGFAMIVGASGSGKSSLAHAGVAAHLVRHGFEDDTVEWRHLTFLPVATNYGLCHRLAQSLAGAIDDLADSESTVDSIADGFADNAALTVKLTIQPAFARLKPVKLLIILDQLETLYTSKQIGEQEREAFLAAVEALAGTGHILFLATLRSDFYFHAQRSPVFLRLKGERGHFDLVAPDTRAIHRMITEPARLSGVTFERKNNTNWSLDEEILQDASRDADALPLLEYTLCELYHQRDTERAIMTFDSYRELGGVDGAIGKRAETIYGSLPAEAQKAFSEILPLLVSVDVAGEQAAVARRATISEVTSTEARQTLVDQLVQARFLTTDLQDDEPVICIAHEALLRSWPRVVDWININREHLAARVRVEQLQQRWDDQGRESSLLLQDGVPLAEGANLLGKAPTLLTDATRQYIAESILNADRRQLRKRRVRRAVTALLMIGVTLTSWQWWRANEEAESARIAEQKTLAANGQLTRAMSEVKRAKDRADTNTEKAIVEAERARKQLYVSRLYAANRDMKDGNILPMVRQLDRIRPSLEGEADYRGFDWYYLWNSFNHGLQKHVLAPVSRVAYSPDGRLIAMAIRIGLKQDTIRIHEVGSMDEKDAIARLPGHSDEIVSLQFSKDGSRLLSVGRDMWLRVWDTKTLKSIFERQSDYSVDMTASLSPDGAQVLTNSPLQIIDIDSGKSRQIDTSGKVEGDVVWSPAGDLIAYGTEKGFTIRDLEGTDAIRPFDVGFTPAVIEFDTSGKRIATAGRLGTVVMPDLSTIREAETVVIWDIESGTKQLSISAGKVTDLSFNGDGTQLGSARADGRIQIWGTSDGQEINSFVAHLTSINDISFAPHSGDLASAAQDGLKVWQSGFDEHGVFREEQRGLVYDVAITPDGSLIANTAGTSIQIRDGKTGDDVTTLTKLGDRPASYARIAFMNNGEQIVAGSNFGEVDIWNIQGGEYVALTPKHTGRVTGLAVCEAKGLLATADTHKVVRIWEAETGKLLHSLSTPIRPDFCIPMIGDRKDNQQAGTTIAFSSDGGRLAVACHDGDFFVYETEAYEKVLTISEDQQPSVFDVKIRPGMISQVRVGMGGGLLDEIVFPGSMSRPSICFSPDGGLLATSNVGRDVNIWDAATGKRLAVLKGHRDAIESIAFSEDGLRIFTGSRDQRIGVWDASSGELLLELEGHKGWVTSLGVSANGDRIVSGGRDQLIRVWEAPRSETETMLQLVFAACIQDGDYDRAVALSEQLVSIKRVSSGEESTLYLGQLRNHAEVLASVGRRSEAIEVYDDVLSGCVKALGESDQFTLNTMNNFALFLSRIGEDERALQLWRKRVEIGRRQYGASDPETMVSLRNLLDTLIVRQMFLEGSASLADLLRASSTNTRNQQLAVNYLKALDEKDPSGQFVDVDSNLVPIAFDSSVAIKTRKDLLAVLARRHRRAGRFQRANHLSEERLRLHRESDGDTSTDTLTCGLVLADQYVSAGEPKRALALLRQMFQICKTELGANHKETVRMQYRLAKAYHDAGDIETALQQYEAVLPVHREVWGPTDRETLILTANFAIAIAQNGELYQALQMLDELIPQMKSELEKADPETISSSILRLQVLLGLGDVDRACPEFVAICLDLIPALVSTQSIETKQQLGQLLNAMVEVMHTTSSDYLKKGEIDTALSICEAVVVGHVRANAPPIPTAYQAFMQHGSCLLLKEDWKLAAFASKKAEAIADQGSMHAGYKAAAKSLKGDVLMGMEDYGNAEEKFIEVCELLESNSEIPPEFHEKLMEHCRDSLSKIEKERKMPIENEGPAEPDSENGPALGDGN